MVSSLGGQVAKEVLKSKQLRRRTFTRAGSRAGHETINMTGGDHMALYMQREKKRN